MKSRKNMGVFILLSMLLSGCYSACDNPNGQSLVRSPRVTDMPETASLRNPIARPLHGLDNIGHTRGEVWAVPQEAQTDVRFGKSSQTNNPWTTVVYVQSTFIIANNESLEGKMALHIGRDGTVSASLPAVSAAAAASPDKESMIYAAYDMKSRPSPSDDKPTLSWLRQFFGKSGMSCANAATLSDSQPEIKDVLELQYMLARVPRAAAPMAAFGVRVSANGRSINHSEIIGGSGQMFIAEFEDSTHAAKNVGTDLNVFRIHITAKPVDAYATGRDNLSGQVLNATFSPQGHTLYVVNVGFVLRDQQGLGKLPKTGALVVNQSMAPPSAK